MALEAAAAECTEWWGRVQGKPCCWWRSTQHKPAPAPRSYTRLELFKSCGVTGFRFFLAPLSLKLEGLLKYLWLDSIGIGWQKRGEQSKIKREECDRDYSESDSNSKKEEPSL